MKLRNPIFHSSLIYLLLISLLLSACGPGETETPAPTATSPPPPTATFTPEPTPTATPVPYDLSLTVTDEEGAAVTGSAGQPGRGEVATDAGGAASFSDLSGADVSIAVSAQGYLPVELSETLERGQNQVTMTLARDPAGLLSQNACAPGEKLLYITTSRTGRLRIGARWRCRRRVGRSSRTRTSQKTWSRQPAPARRAPP